MILTLPLAAATLLGVASAQQSRTLPIDTLASSDGNSSYVMAGFSSDARQQILVDASVLGPQLIGRTLTSIAFRRDLGWREPLTGGEADLTITLSKVARAAANASTSFLANSDAASRTLVFQGRVTIPSSPRVDGRSATWTADVVGIPFGSTYLYTGGGLCIEILGRQVAGSAAKAWPIDAVHDPASGAVATAGDSCGSTAHASINPWTLVPGFSASFFGDGPPGVPAVFLLGHAIPPIDLGAFGLGAPGCELRVAPWVSMTTLFEDHSAKGLILGAATVTFQIPADPGVLSMPFSCQFVAATLPIETTNSLDCALAGSMPSIGMSSVRARLDGPTIPTAGRVWSTRAPVLRLESR